MVDILSQHKQRENSWKYSKNVCYVWIGSGLDGLTGPRGRTCNKIPVDCLNHWSSCNVLHATPDSGKATKMVKMISRIAKRIILLDNAIRSCFKVTDQWIKIKEVEQNEFFEYRWWKVGGSTPNIYIYHIRRQ